MKTVVFLALLALAVPALGGETFRDCRECPEMVALPAGTFQMGETGRRNAMPVHAVALPAFAIGKYEVTQGEWKALMGANPSQNAACGDACPVENVSWNDAREFARRLGARTGNDLPPALRSGMGICLPGWRTARLLRQQRYRTKWPGTGTSTAASAKPGKNSPTHGDYST